jgi:acyl-coenzyme A synthetase/AMP-(fatty) acid ligase
MTSGSALVAAAVLLIACKRVPVEETGRARPAAAPAPGEGEPVKTCIGKNLADKAMLGAARDPQHQCPSTLDGKLYITSQWPAAITLDYQENPALDLTFTTSARQYMPTGDAVMGPPCCYVTTKAKPK